MACSNADDAHSTEQLELVAAANHFRVGKRCKMDVCSAKLVLARN